QQPVQVAMISTTPPTATQATPTTAAPSATPTTPRVVMHRRVVASAVVAPAVVAPAVAPAVVPAGVAPTPVVDAAVAEAPVDVVVPATPSADAFPGFDVHDGWGTRSADAAGSSDGAVKIAMVSSKALQQAAQPAAQQAKTCRRAIALRDLVP